MVPKHRSDRFVPLKELLSGNVSVWKHHSTIFQSSLRSWCRELKNNVDRKKKTTLRVDKLLNQLTCSRAAVVLMRNNRVKGHLSSGYLLAEHHLGVELP